MRYGERHLVPHLMSVQRHCRLDMRAFEVEGHWPTGPRRRDVHRALVPCIAHVVALGRQEEGVLHLPLHAVFLHVGIEEEAGVVERAGPSGVDAQGVALAVGQHRARQRHRALLAFGTELPFAAQVYCLG